MGQNKHVVLEINKGHGQLDKTFNKEHNQSFHTICLAGISLFYITTNNYPTAVAVHVTKASSLTTRRGPGKATNSDGLHIMSRCPIQLLFSFKGLDSNWGIMLLGPLFWGQWAAALFLRARVTWMKTRESTKIPKLNSSGETLESYLSWLFLEFLW